MTTRARQLSWRRSGQRDVDSASLTQFDFTQIRRRTPAPGPGVDPIAPDPVNRLIDDVYVYKTHLAGYSSFLAFSAALVQGKIPRFEFVSSRPSSPSSSPSSTKIYYQNGDVIYFFSATSHYLPVFDLVSGELEAVTVPGSGLGSVFGPNSSQSSHSAFGSSPIRDGRESVLHTLILEHYLLDKSEPYYARFVRQGPTDLL